MRVVYSSVTILSELLTLELLSPQLEEVPHVFPAAAPFGSITDARARWLGLERKSTIRIHRSTSPPVSKLTDFAGI